LCNHRSATPPLKSREDGGCLNPSKPVEKMKQLKEFYRKYKDYGLDLAMYLVFVVALLMLFIFFS
jgi:hypothetical protein